MLGRLFGRSKEDNDETICATCGRTLLAGEWTQRLVDDDGRERYVCSLCSRPAEAVDDVGTPAPEVAAVGNGRVKPARADSDVFWRAIKDKDAEIERLESLLARSEAEKQELAAQLAALQAAGGAAAAAADEPAAAGEAPLPAADAEAALPVAEAKPLAAGDATGDELAPAVWADDVGQTLDVPPAAFARAESGEDIRPATPEAGWSDVGGETVEIPPDDLERVLAGDDVAEDLQLGAGAAAQTPLEHTDPSLGDALRAAQADAPVVAGFEADGTIDEAGVPSATQIPLDDVAGDERDIVIVRPGGPPVGAEGTGFDGDDDLMPLTLLQRGVDLLNVSAVPRRIVETNESLGLPQVHVGSQSDSVLLVTFMWTMGWYQFCVELSDGGRITLAERGYEERVDLRPNASVRADGTVQLAPTQIKPPTPRDTDGAKPVGVTSGVIISKSMKGQRTDDENVPADWKSKRAPDFDWGR